MNTIRSHHPPPHTLSQQSERADAADKAAQAGGVWCLGSSSDRAAQWCAPGREVGHVPGEHSNAHSLLTPKSCLQVYRDSKCMDDQMWLQVKDGA